MKSKIKKVVCVVLAVLIICSIIVLFLSVPRIARSVKGYMVFGPSHSVTLRPNGQRAIIWSVLTTFAIVLLLFSSFLLFLALKNSNFIEYLKANTMQIREKVIMYKSRCQKRKEKNLRKQLSKIEKDIGERQ